MHNLRVEGSFFHFGRKEKKRKIIKEDFFFFWGCSLVYATAFSFTSVVKKPFVIFATFNGEGIALFVDPFGNNLLCAIQVYGV